LNATRRIFAAAAPATFAAALLGCTALSPAANANIQQILGVASAVMNYAGPIMSLLSIFVPGASAVVPLVETGLNAALNVANTVVSTMTTAQAQPLVGQIATDLKGAFTAAGQGIDAIPNATQRAQAQAILTQAEAGVPLLEAFAAGVAVAIKPPTVAARFGGVLVPPLRIVMAR
jgi:hypothetical protein